MSKIIEVTCTACKKQFMMDEWHYNYRSNRNEGRGVFCSVKCGHSNVTITDEQRSKISKSLKKAWTNGEREPSETHIEKCATCGKKLELKHWEYNTRISRNKGRGFFCSRECEQGGRVARSDETKRKISESQRGISVPTRGRPGHVLTEETKRKIRESKKKMYKHVVSDWKIVRRAAEDEGLQRYVVMQKPIPDIVFVENGKLVAVEVEKKPFFTSVKVKMDMYRMNTHYDKVILRWYNVQGEFQNRWIYENGVWSESHV